MNIGTRINDAMQLYNFDKKDGAITGPKLKFPKAVYDRIKTFRVGEAAENDWTPYGVTNLILGQIDKREYYLNPAVSRDVELEPSEEFKKWLKEHHTFGPVLIMLALVYGNYELED